MLAAALVLFGIGVVCIAVCCVLMTCHQLTISQDIADIRHSLQFREDIAADEALGLLRREFGGEIEPDHVARLPRQMFEDGWDREADDPLAAHGLDQDI